MPKSLEETMPNAGELNAESADVGGSHDGPGSLNGGTHASVLGLIEPDKLVARRASKCMDIDNAPEQRSLV